MHAGPGAPRASPRKRPTNSNAVPSAGGSLPRLPGRRRPAAIGVCVRRAIPAALVWGVLAVAGATAAAAQNFGRNDVAWTRFQWQGLRTGHFDITFYPDEDAAAHRVALAAERWYDRLARQFGVKPARRTPLVLYADQSDFQKTVTAPERIAQGTGGFLEPRFARVIV